MRADTTAESIWGTPEYQCRPHSAPHQWRGLGGARILKEQDPLTREVRAYHIQFMRSLDWPVFMDGRPHPPAWAPHSWTGFSTGEWIGNTLKITTTHLKDGYLKRGGPQTSDLFTMTDYITRHDDILTIVTVVDDPVYQDEPYVESTTYTIDLTSNVAMETCNGSSFAENGGTDRHHVPHFLPGQNTALTEWLKKDDWIPVEPTRGGVKTIYPEYRSTFDGDGERGGAEGSGVEVGGLRREEHRRSEPARRPGPRAAGAGQHLHARGRRHQHHRVDRRRRRDARQHRLGGDDRQGAGGRQPAREQRGDAAGAEHVLRRELSEHVGLVEPVHQLGDQLPGSAKPVRYIINTSAAPEHVGGNEKIAATGFFPRGGGFGAAVTSIGRNAEIVAHENVLNRMTEPATPGGKPAPAAAQPNDTYFDEFHKLPEYFNGEAVILYHAPAANTDGDSLVFFRHSEVISAGDLMSTVSYPVIDVAKGGSIQGVIDGLNHILDLAVAEYRGQGGTWIIPGRGGCRTRPTSRRIATC